MASEIRNIGVVGAGTMGSGIAQVAASSGYRATLVDVDRQALERAIASIERSLDKLVGKGRIEEETALAAKEHLATASDIKDLGDADLVVEAVVEKLEVKQAIFQDLDSVTSTDAILASNTSSISITRLAAATSRPEKVIGMHFMNPVPLMKLVEIIRGLATDDATYGAVEKATKQMGKTPVEVNDAPGFVSNRVLMPMINEAVFCLHEGVGKPEAIDEVMHLGMNHPLGPLALADLIGLDVCLDIMRVMHRELGDSKYRPCPLLVKMVDAGRLGRKSGQGFYAYE